MLHLHSDFAILCARMFAALWHRCTKIPFDRPRYARKFEFCQWTMGSIQGHPALRLVLDNIVTFYERHTDEEIAVGPQEKPQTVNATGPGIWTDTLHERVSMDTHGQGKA